MELPITTVQISTTLKLLLKTFAILIKSVFIRVHPCSHTSRPDYPPDKTLPTIATLHHLCSQHNELVAWEDKYMILAQSACSSRRPTFFPLHAERTTPLHTRENDP